MWLGHRYHNYVRDWLDGNLSKVGYWNRTLSAAEVLALYGGADPTTSTYNTDLVSYWPCNAAAGSNVADSLGVHNASWSGTPAWGVGGVVMFTLANPINLEAGRTYKWICKTLGNRGISFGSKFEFEGATTAQITETAGKTDIITGTVSSDGTKIFGSIQNNFA